MVQLSSIKARRSLNSSYIQIGSQLSSNSSIPALQMELPPARVHVMFVYPLVLPSLAVKRALLQAAQLQGEARAQLLQSHDDRFLAPLFLLFKDVTVVPAGMGDFGMPFIALGHEWLICHSSNGLRIATSVKHDAAWCLSVVSGMDDVRSV